MKCYAYQYPSESIIFSSSSGAMFSRLAEQILEKKGAVYGAAFNENWGVYHKRINQISELDSLRRSKYVYGNISDSIPDLLKTLKEGTEVLYCALPCQIAAIHKVACNYPNLLLVELVCHGAPEPKYWNSYLSLQCSKLKKHISDIENINFRDKRTGWRNYSFSIKFKNGEEFTQLHDNNLFMKAFLKNYTLRNACFNCKFKYPKGSRADITIGDFWGINILRPEINSKMNSNLGVNLVIGRTKKGIDYISDIISEQEFDFNSILKFNTAIISPPSRPSKLERFRTDFNKTDILTLLSKYTTDPLILRIKRKIKFLVNS